MALTDVQIRKAQPKDKPYKLADGRGLFLLVTPAGGRWWRLRYRHGGKENMLSLGTYPEIGLRTARERCEDARRLNAEGIDPSANRKAIKATERAIAEDSFEVVAREWYSKKSTGWVPEYGGRILRRLECDVFPWLGASPMREITAPKVLTVLRRIEERGVVETAHRTLHNLGQVFRYAVATGRADRDPTADLRGALPPAPERHLAAVTDPVKAAELLRAIHGYKGSLVTLSALRLAPLLFVRPGELRQAEWSEIDLERAEWNIPAIKMKMREPHLVPLSRQAVEILGELRPLTGRGRYVFPCGTTASRPMSNNAVLSALRRMGIEKSETSGHGFRAMARTMLDEVLRVRPDLIEHQLAHAVRDPNGRAYNRTAFIEERREMMQRWADYLDDLRNGDGANVQVDRRASCKVWTTGDSAKS